MGTVRTVIDAQDVRTGVWNAMDRHLGGQNKGVKAGTGVSVKETNGKTVLTFTNVSVATVDAGAAGAGGSLKVYDFPEGLLDYRGAVSNLTISRVGVNIIATAAVVAALGTVAAAADATLTGTEADLVPSITATLTAGAGTAVGVSTTAQSAIIDGTTTAKDAYLNFAMPDASSTGNDSLLVNGTVTLAWSFIADK